MEKLYTVKETAELTGHKPSTIAQYAKIGEIKGEKYGGRWRFNKEQIQEFMEKRRAK